MQFAEIFYTHYPGFMGINWIDPEGFIRWVFPDKTNAMAKDRSAYQHPDPRYRAAFEKAEQGLEHAVTPCLELLQGGVGFETFWPLIYEGKVQGYLNGVFQVELIMNTCLAKRMFEDFNIRVYEAERLIYHHGTQGGKAFKANGIHVLLKTNFGGKTWEIQLEPKPTIFSPGSLRNLHVLVFGLGLSAALSLLLHFLAQRMAMYKHARDQALHEVGERRRAEETLRENEKKLEALLAELATKNVELESFVYTVSHDLKTPIVTVEGFIGALEEDFGNILSEEGKGYLKHMSDASRKMEALINDLLELSRLGRLTEKKREIPFAKLVEDALRGLQPQIEARGIVVNVQGNLPVVYCESKRLGQVMDNLLANAVKYIGQDNASPRIDVGVEEQDGQKKFFVRDNGIGIEEKYFGKVFEIFQRLPSAKQGGEGTGIGLTIVKRIIEQHGGRIWVASERGKGTTFFFTLSNKEA